MKYSTTQAQKFARQIRERFGERIARATHNTPIPQEFIAGLIGVEAGKDRNGQFKESATRFENHVYLKLRQLREGEIKSYNKISRAQVKDASEEALEALATSYGLSQIMGWWVLHLGGTIADLRSPEKHLDYTVKLLLLNSDDGGDFERREYVGEFRQWNSGRETGKTHDPDYVHNAGAVMDAYRELGEVEIPEKQEPVKEEPKQSVTPRVAETPKPEPPQTIPAIPPLPVNVPDWAKKIVGWGAGLNFGGLGISFAFLQNNPEALAAILNILKWGLIALGGVVLLIVIGVFIKAMWNAKLANDLNVARLRNYADKDTHDVDFSGWKAAPDKAEVKL